MAFDGLERTPGVAPLLVRLYDTHNLYTLAGEKECDDARLELSAIMVDLLKINLSDREKELITDVLLGLIKQAEKDLRLALSERLSGMDNVPLRMVLGLANDDIDIADPVLRLSPVLHDLDLAYILQARGVTHGRSIAQRKGLSSDIINMLADTKDFQIAVNLSNNDGVSLTEHAYRIYAEMAKNNETLATPLLGRSDVPLEVAGKLYEFVGEELKNMLRKKYGSAAIVATNAVDDIVLEVGTGAANAEAAEHLIHMAKNLEYRGELKVSVMISNLRRGQNATFLAEFSVFCKIPADQAKKVVCEKSGKALATVCRGLDVTKGDFVSLYLLTDKFRSGSKKVINHKELSRIMVMFDEIHPDDAKVLLKNLRH
jgi:uncharacterized protein (DUF2336 family)